VRPKPGAVGAIRSHDRVAHWAARYPDKLAIGYGGRWITYGEWHERVQEQARSLQGDASPVALVYDAADGVDFAVGYAAAHAAARPALVLNPRIPGRDLRAQIDFAGAGTVLSGDGHDVEPAREPRAEPLLDRWGEPLAEISFSSGTTGEPKGILLSHRALAWAGVLAGELAYAARHRFDMPGDPLSADDTLVSAFQAGSAGTTNGFLNCGLAVGARMHFLPKFDATTFTAFMESVEATVFYGAPAHLALWRQGEPDAVPTARSYVVIGQALASVDAEWFLKRRGRAHLVNCYGLTESCAGMTVAFDDDVARPGMIGRPVDGVEIRVVEPDGRDAESEGELIMRCFGMMEGYLDRPDLTAEKLRDGWLSTGDIVERCGDAYVIRGRTGDRINRGGYKFDPMDVEDVAATVEGVTGAVACAISHPVLGEDVALAVEVANHEDPDTVREAVVSTLAWELPKFKVPRQIRVVREMPRSALGKPQRAVVAAWFAQSQPQSEGLVQI
jgi:long-chain acyl-CoA synthetase